MRTGQRDQEQSCGGIVKAFATKRHLAVKAQDHVLTAVVRQQVITTGSESTAKWIR